MNRIFDFLINLCKWPTALIVLALIPGLIESYSRFNFFTMPFYFILSRPYLPEAKSAHKYRSSPTN